MATVVPSYYELLGFHMQGDLNGYTAYTSSRNKVVWFAKSPPLSPPSAAQISFRNLFRINGILWQALTHAEQQTWMQSAIGARLRIHGYDLFVWYNRYLDDAILRTIERLSGIAISRPS